MGLNQNVLASHYVSNNKLCTRLLYSNIIIRSNNLNITNMSKFFLFSTFSKQKYCVCGCAGCVCDDVYISSLSVFIRVLSCHTGHSSHAYNILSCPKNMFQQFNSICHYFPTIHFQIKNQNSWGIWISHKPTRCKKKSLVCFHIFCLSI